LILFSKRVFKNILESLKHFLTKLSIRLKKFLYPCEISIFSSNIKAKKIPPKFDKNLGCYRLPPLKKSCPRDWRKVTRFMDPNGIRVLPPIKEDFS
jgi:hypothetical protein